METTENMDDLNDTTSDNVTVLPPYILERLNEIQIMKKRFETNLLIDGPMLYFLIFLHALLITFGTLGNCLTICAVIRKTSMRTPRNMFILNLAVSDLLLCLITAPLTLVLIVTAYFPFGYNRFLCKTILSLHAVSIFVSSITITAIALDRYHVIVYPTKPSLQRMGAVSAVLGIWALACTLSAPLFIWSDLKHFILNSTMFPAVDYCVEDWGELGSHGRFYYSLFSIIVQYAVPITVISIAYCRICKKLRYRMKPGGGCRAAESTASTNGGTSGGGVGKRGGSVLRKEQGQGRVRRTNMLLISIAIIFGISWMPLNIYNLVVDLFNPFNGETYPERIVFILCHWFAMSSANTNPLLYGFFNDNFRKEFYDMWLSLKSFYCCCCCLIRRDGNEFRGRGIRGGESRGDREPTATVHYRKSTNSKASPPDAEAGGGDGDQDADGDVEQSMLITQVLDRQK